MQFQQGQVVRVGGLQITISNRCNRIDVVPMVGRWHTFFYCGNCGRDLEVTRTGASYRHTAGFHAISEDIQKG